MSAIPDGTERIMLAMLGWTELVVIGVVAVLIFGRRLPDVGRSLGESLVEFKKGLKGVEDLSLIHI